MKIRIRLIRARPYFYTISENPNVSLGIVDCSLYTRRVMLKEDHHKKRRSQLAYAPVEYNYMETLAMTYIIPARQNQFIQENIFNNSPLRRIAIAMNSNSAFTDSNAENPFWYQQFNQRDIRILRGGQPIVHHDTTDKLRFYVTTMKAMSFQDDFPSIPVDNFKDHYVLVFDLTSTQDATEHCHYPELIGEPLKMELYFSSLLENVTKFIVLGERMSSVAVDKIGVVGKMFEMDNTSLNQIVNRILLLKYRYVGSFPSDVVPNLPNDTFVIINTQPSKTPGEPWRMMAKFHHELYFADSLGLSINNYPFPKRNYSQIVRTRLQDHLSVCGFYTIITAFHLFKFQQEEITGVHDVFVLSFINNFMWLITNLLWMCNFYNVFVQICSF